MKMQYSTYEDCPNCGWGVFRQYPLSPLWESAEPPEEELVYLDVERIILQCVNCEETRLIFLVERGL